MILKPETMPLQSSPHISLKLLLLLHHHHHIFLSVIQMADFHEFPHQNLHLIPVHLTLLDLITRTIPAVSDHFHKCRTGVTYRPLA